MLSAAEVPLPFPDMVWIPGGTFPMGSDKHYPEERPVHRVTVDGFWMDRHPVTNERFARFVDETGHVTFAEIPPDPAQYPGALPECCTPVRSSSSKPAGPVDRRDIPNWWHLHAGRRLAPSARAGQHDRRARATTRSCMSPSPTPRRSRVGGQGAADRSRVGVRRPRRARRRGVRLGRRVPARRSPYGEHWQGDFPWQSTAKDGYEGTSPVGAFPPNGYGLVDMIGNVWEWTTDWYAPGHPDEEVKACCMPPIRADRARRTATIRASRRSRFRARC